MAPSEPFGILFLVKVRFMDALALFGMLVFLVWLLLILLAGPAPAQIYQYIK